MHRPRIAIRVTRPGIRDGPVADCERLSPDNDAMHLVELIRHQVERLIHSERGQGMVEYALILVLIAVVVIAVLIVLGNQVQNVFCNISGAMGQ
jgi:pilus assembly protein Flp/PilA